MNNVLPQELRLELNEALASPDAARVTGFNRLIAKPDPAPGAVLAHHADRLACAATLHAPSASNSTGKTAS